MQVFSQLKSHIGGNTDPSILQGSSFLSCILIIIQQLDELQKLLSVLKSNLVP